MALTHAQTCSHPAVSGAWLYLALRSRLSTQQNHSLTLTASVLCARPVPARPSGCGWPRSRQPTR